LELAGGFEDGQRAEDVHARAVHRVGPAERHLQGRQVDDSGRLLAAHDLEDGRQVGDVAGLDGDAVGSAGQQVVEAAEIGVAVKQDAGDFAAN
jgi:hypothetical protein